MKLKVLITGADGLLGSNLVRLLLEKKYSVSVFLYYNTKSPTLKDLKIKKIYGDVTNPDSLDIAIKGQDIVVHAAASTSLWPNRSEIVRKINIEGTKNVVEKVLQHNVKKLIFIGSASSVKGMQNVYDANLYNGRKYNLDYVDSKFEALDCIMNAVKTRNLPAVAVLPTYMIGPYDSKPGSGRIILNTAKGNMKLCPRGGKNFVHVLDVAKVVDRLINSDIVGKYFVVGNTNLTYMEFLELTAKIVGKSAPLFSMPSWLILTIGYMGSLYGKMFRKEPFLSYELAFISCETQFINRDSVVEFNIERTPVEVAIEDCYNWFQNNNYLNN